MMYRFYLISPRLFRRMHFYGVGLTALFGVVLLLSLSSPVISGGWEALTEKEKAVLYPFESNWKAMTAQRQARLREIARRWAKMTERERDAMKEKFIHWQKLTSAEQREIKKRLNQFQALSKEQQDRVRKQFFRFQSLPEKQRKEFKDRWNSLTPQERELLKAVRKQGLEHDATEAESSR